MSSPLEASLLPVITLLVSFLEEPEVLGCALAFASCVINCFLIRPIHLEGDKRRACNPDSLPHSILTLPSVPIALVHRLMIFQVLPYLRRQARVYSRLCSIYSDSELCTSEESILPIFQAITT